MLTLALEAGMLGAHALLEQFSGLVAVFTYLALILFHDHNAIALKFRGQLVYLFPT